MRALVLAVGLLAAATSIARAEGDADDAAPTTEDQLVVVNAASRMHEVGQVERIRRVLDARHMLHRLPEHLEAALDGRDVQIGDAEQIQDAYMQLDYKAARKLIDADEARVLEASVAGDPVPALAELAQWRGLIAYAQEQPDDAVRWFRAAYRLNPAWTVDKKLASPSVRALVKKAKHEPAETGVLRVDVDPEEARVSIDGAEGQDPGRYDITVGYHLVRITAKGYAPYTELVEISQKRTEKVAITLDTESKSYRAARLVDETTAAPPGQARLKGVRALSRVTGVKRYLIIEDGTDDHVSVRVYDVGSKKVSMSFDVQGSESSAAIARLVQAALEPDNMIDANSIAGRAEKKKWYDHWYVWAAVGAVAIGTVGGYEYMSRSPTLVKGFE
jgi:tetratricopeptide (TPR) repeat protein